MKNNKKDITLGKQIYLNGNGPNFIAAFLIFWYSVLLAEISFKNILITFTMVAVMVLFCVYVLSPITNIMITEKISRKAEEWKSSKGSTDEDRTNLLNEMYKLPRYKQFETFIYFTTCAVVLALFYHFVMKVEIIRNCLQFAGCLFGAYIAGLLSLNASSSYIIILLSRYGLYLKRVECT